MPKVEFSRDQNSLSCHLDYELVRVEPWARDGVRVRATRLSHVKEDWPSALLNQGDYLPEIEVQSAGASLRNGTVLVKVSPLGELSFVNAHTGKELLREKAIHALTVPARCYSDVKGELFHIEACFEAYDDEHVYGLGQHQHGRLDQKGCVIDLVQRNMEVSIPFLLSSRGYGFLWNNPAVGRVELGRNATRWIAEAAPQIDYWITADDQPARVLSNYADATGHAPMLPQWASGFWQSKLRYASQEELEAVAQEYERRNLPLSVLAIDFFHWTRQGEWRFDPEHWPDPAGMVKKLEKLGVKVMVSIWPTVSRLSDTYQEMWHRGYIVRNMNGSPAHMYFVDNHAENGIYVHYYDPTHPEARKYVWEKVKQGYYRHGVKVYWLDACEPEMLPMTPGNLRFYAGDGEAVANVYPMQHVQAFCEGMREEGENELLFLCRSAWAGSQRYAAAVWSGDIPSTFEALRAQVRAGLNIGLSGIPWWTSDIGGFHDGDPTTPYFRELAVRWFQYGAFCPLFRLHGHRQPSGSDFNGAPNEVWSFGEEAYKIIADLLRLRERMRPYIMEQMQQAHAKGTPPMRPLFFDFFHDPNCFAIEDEFMLGPDLLVAPVLYEGARSRQVYLPDSSTWTDAWSGVSMKGGQWTTADVPLRRIPLYQRDGATLPIRPED
jgi:alpha-D-xyloside xylohydrolase